MVCPEIVVELKIVGGIMRVFKSMLTISMSLILIFNSVLASTQEAKSNQEFSSEYLKLVAALEKQGIQIVD